MMNEKMVNDEMLEVVAGGTGQETGYDSMKIQMSKVLGGELSAPSSFDAIRKAYSKQGASLQKARSYSDPWVRTP